MSTNIMITTTVSSPLGALRLYARAGALVGVYFEAHRPAPRVDPDAIERGDEAVLRRASEQLAEYFAGARTAFDLPIALERGTAFTRSVWSALAGIAHGERITYADLARRLGRPRAVRAVGAANARNPLSIVLPCHRVIGADGSLTGFGGGLPAKQYLLKLEGALPEAFDLFPMAVA